MICETQQKLRENAEKGIIEMRTQFLERLPNWFSFRFTIFAQDYSIELAADLTCRLVEDFSAS